MWAFLCKLAIVANETGQLLLGTGEIPVLHDLLLPTLVNTVIDSFGEFTDASNDVIVAPLITYELLTYLRHIVKMLWHGHAQVEVLNNHRDWTYYCYGSQAHNCLAWYEIAQRWDQGFDVKELTDDGLDNAIFRLVASHAMDSGFQDPQHFNNIWRNAALREFFRPAPHRQFANAGNVFSGQDIQVLRDTRARYNAADSFYPRNLPLPGQWDARFPAAHVLMQISGHVAYLSQHFGLGKFSSLPSGSDAPTLNVHTTGSYTTVLFKQLRLRPQDCVIALLLNIRKTVFCGPDGKPYGYSDSNDWSRGHSSEIAETSSSLIGKALRQSLIGKSRAA
jgi:hypothetical protein